MSDKLGKGYRGQVHVPIKSEEDVRAVREAQAPYDKPGAISLAAYFSVKGIRRPEEQAGRAAHTKVRNATVEDWDAIFATF